MVLVQAWFNDKLPKLVLEPSLAVAAERVAGEKARRTVAAQVQHDDL